MMTVSLKKDSRLFCSPSSCNPISVGADLRVRPGQTHRSALQKDSRINVFNEHTIIFRNNFLLMQTGS
jgi:hypothetical protein